MVSESITYVFDRFYQYLKIRGKVTYKLVNGIERKYMSIPYAPPLLNEALIPPWSRASHTTKPTLTVSSSNIQP